MPTYVLDIPGAHGKVPVGPQYIETQEVETIVRDSAGTAHRYPDCAPPL